MATNEELLRFAREARAGKLKKNPITASPNPPRFSNIGGKNRVVSGGLAPKIREKTKEEKEAVPKFITAGGLTNPTLVENPDYVPPVAPVAPPASRFTGFGGQQNKIAEDAFADASQFLKGGIPTPPMSPLDKGAEQNFTEVGDNEARLRSPQEQAQAIANAQNKALFTVGVTPQGISDTVGAIGAPGSRFTGIDDAALARFGIASSRNKADPEARMAQNRLADANKGRFTGTVGSREAATQGIESRATTERRAGEANALARQQSADTLAGQQGAQDFKAKEQRLKIRDEGRQKQIEAMLAKDNVEGSEELKRQFGYEDQMDTDGSGDLSQQERQKATREMQGILAQFEAMTPEQQAKNKNHPAYMKAIAMRKILQGQAESEAKNVFGF